MPLHPAWAKNVCRRVLWAAFEKDISKAERAAMLKYFEHRCAYCDEVLASRWHADQVHLIDNGGFNHLSNRVPSCADCNEHERRNMDWLEFLRLKVSSQEMLEQRKERIEQWRERNLPATPPVSESQRVAWRKEADELPIVIDEAWRRLKRLKDGDAV